MNISIKDVDEMEKSLIFFFLIESISNFPIAFSCREFNRRFEWKFSENRNQ